MSPRSVFDESSTILFTMSHRRWDLQVFLTPQVTSEPKIHVLQCNRIQRIEYTTYFIECEFLWDSKMSSLQR